MSVGARPVRVMVAVVTLLLIPLLLLATSAANWVAVGQAVDAALRQEPEDLHYFIEAYASGVRAILVLGGLLELGIAVVLVSAGLAILAGRRWGRIVALTVPWLTIGCGAGALTINPITKVRWSGDPDGESLVRDHFPAWNWPVLCTLLVLIGLCCLVTTVLLAITRSADLRRA